MPNIVFLTGNYENDDAVRNLVSYIASSPYIEGVGGYGCFYALKQDFVSMIDASFRAVRNVNAVQKGKLVHHIIIGFGDVPNITQDQAAEVAYRVASCFFCGGYQVFWGMHFGSDSDDSYRHLHFAVNPISMRDGGRFSLTYDIANGLVENLRKSYSGVEWYYMYKQSVFY